MSRFEHLEFGAAQREPTEAAAAGTPIRDATYFQAQAEKYYLNGDYELALRNYSRSLEQNSAHFEGWFGQVRMLIELREYEEASLWSNKALELFPENPELLAAKAVASLRTGDLEKAMAYTDNALSRKGTTSYVWLARAEALLDQGKVTAAHCLSNAIALAGSAAPVVHLEAGRLLLGAGQFMAALEHLRRAAQALPRSALAWLEMARCQAALGFPEAEAAIAQCLALRPDWREAQTVMRHIQNSGFFERIRCFFRRHRGG